MKLLRGEGSSSPSLSQPGRPDAPTPVLLQSFASAGARLATTVTLLLTISLAVRKLSSEEFGLWSILLSLMFLATTFDFGFRYGLSNRLAALIALPGGNSKLEESTMFLSVFMLQVAIAVCGSAICLCVLPHVPWERLLSIRQPDLATHAASTMTIAGCFFFLYLPFSLWGSAFYAHNEIALASMLSALQSLILLAVFVFAAFKLHFQDLVIAYFAAYVLTGVLITAALFVRRSWTLQRVASPGLTGSIRSISRPSLEFFVLSFAGALTATAGTCLSGTVTGLKEAGDFSLIQKIFSLLVTLHLAFLSPLSPAYTQYARLGNWNWVRQKLIVSVQWTWPVVFLGGGLLLVACHPVLVWVWTGKWLTDFTLAGILALWAMAIGWTNTYSVALNSLGLVRFQGIVFVAMMLPVLLLPLVLGRWWGIHGVALASLLCALPALVLWPLYTAKALRQKRLVV
ncbi:MAG: hypothetical protein WCL44_01975 [bacterium]